MRAQIGRTLEDKFTFLLTRLNVGGTRSLAEKHAPFAAGSFPQVGGGIAALKVPEDVSGLSD